MKLYAVQKGKNPGIYFTWDKCKKNIIGFPNSCYKSFDYKSTLDISELEKLVNENNVDYNSSFGKALKEAISFIEQETDDYDNIDLSKIERYLFVDGSFNKKTNVYGYGGFIQKKNEDGEYEKIVIGGCDNNKEAAKLRNIAGEVLGALTGVEYAVNLGLKDIVVFYDYNGISRWATGEWKTKSNFIKDYVKKMQNLMKKIKITWVKVKGHSGIDGNEEADKIAKQWVGIK